MIVKFEIEIPVLATDEREAKSFIGQALDDTSDLEDYCNVEPLNYKPCGYDHDDLIYHNGNEDITLGQLLEMSLEYQEIQRRLKDAQAKFLKQCLTENEENE